jgi:hypothetical protein
MTGRSALTPRGRELALAPVGSYTWGSDSTIELEGSINRPTPGASSPWSASHVAYAGRGVTPRASAPDLAVYEALERLTPHAKEALLFQVGPYPCRFRLSL